MKKESVLRSALAHEKLCSAELSAELLTAKETIRELRKVCGEAYQLAGAIGAPVAALDNLSDAANGGQLRHATFLPAMDTDCEKLRDLLAAKERVQELEKIEQDRDDWRLAWSRMVEEVVEARQYFKPLVATLERTVASQAEEIAGLKRERADCPWCSAGEKPVLKNVMAALFENTRLRKQIASQSVVIEKAREALGKAPHDKECSSVDSCGCGKCDYCLEVAPAPGTPCDCFKDEALDLLSTPQPSAPGIGETARRLLAGTITVNEAQIVMKAQVSASMNCARGFHLYRFISGDSYVCQHCGSTDPEGDSISQMLGSAASKLDSQAVVIENAREALEEINSLTRESKEVPQWMGPDWSYAMKLIRSEIRSALALLSTPQPSATAACKLCNHMHVGRCREDAPNAQFRCACAGECPHGGDKNYCKECDKLTRILAILAEANGPDWVIGHELERRIREVVG